MITKRFSRTLKFATSLLFVSVCGCPFEPPEAAVLEGTWELIPTALPPELAECLLTFNFRGDLARVKFTLMDETTITWNNPPSETIVDGDQISITVETFNNSLTFEGALDSETEPESAEGEFSVSATFGDVTISEQAGEAILVRQ
jgi:hypothetical protein